MPFWRFPPLPPAGICRRPPHTDDGYIKVKLSVSLKVLSDIQQVFKEDSGLELQLYVRYVLYVLYVRYVRYVLGIVGIVGIVGKTYLTIILGPVLVALEGLLGFSFPFSLLCVQ